MKKLGRNSIKVIAATSVTVFSLLSCLSAVIAWFSVIDYAQNGGGGFNVKNSACEVENVNLYKFNYGHMEIDGDQFVDYLAPEKGEVGKYEYNSTEEEFGYYDNEVWTPVDVMNIFDPIDLIISSSSLIDLNCNAIYEVTISSSDFEECVMKIQSELIEGRTKGTRDIFLSDCADFDFYLPSDISNSNPALANKAYYPSYIEQSTVLSADEEIYYRISYLSSLEDSHTNFYSALEKPNAVDITTGTNVTFVDDLLTVYVNVNYSPSQLRDYASEIHLRNIMAIYDFFFTFTFTGGAS